MTRREALGTIFGSIVGFGLGLNLVDPENRTPGELFGKIHQTLPDPYLVCEKFIKANSAELMAYYGVFFPQFLSKYGRGAIIEIKRVAPSLKAEYPYNHHRLKALPAVVAAHLIQQTKPSDQEDLSDVISSGLNSRDRLVRDIILQNLITSTAVNPDSIRFYRVGDQILEAIKKIVDESADIPSLIAPLCLATEFLLNYRLLIKNKDNITNINKLIEYIHSFKAPHMWYAKELIRIHEGFFVSLKSAGIPPQRSELLLGYSSYPTRYVAHQALIWTRNTFDEYNTAIGKYNFDSQVISAKTALQAYPKGLAYLKYHNIARLLPSAYELDFLALPREESHFQKFLSAELKYLMNNDESIQKFKPSEYEIELSECVPFSQFSDRSIVEKVFKSNKKEKRRWFRDAVSVGFPTAMTVGPGFLLMYQAFKAIFGREIKTEIISDSDKKETVIQHVEDTKKRFKLNLEDALDEQERDIGSFILDDEQESLKHTPFIIGSEE